MSGYEFYDIIPNFVFDKTILEVGAGTGESQLASRHRNRFLEPEYLGFDINLPKEPLVNIQQKNVLKWDTDKKFDTVLAIELIEHIPFRDWFLLFDNLKKWTNIGGYLVITTEYKQKIEKYLKNVDSINPTKEYYQYHVVFGITENLIRHFLPNATIKVDKRTHFRAKGETLIWAIGRFIKRVITRHPYAFQNYKHLLIIWRRIL